MTEYSSAEKYLLYDFLMLNRVLQQGLLPCICACVFNLWILKFFAPASLSFTQYEMRNLVASMYLHYQGNNSCGFCHVSVLSVPPVMSRLSAAMSICITFPLIHFIPPSKYQRKKFRKPWFISFLKKVIILEAKYKIIKEHGNGKYQLFTKELDLVKLENLVVLSSG